ncbi:MAG: hypothetical protein CL912_27255 [Deltaproteobacteria bacterium]|nr:hypothetical protein [Deltaproteobacteria bacterium]
MIRLRLAVGILVVQREFLAGVTDNMTAFLAGLVVEAVGPVALFLRLFGSVISKQAIKGNKFTVILSASSNPHISVRERWA